jgi:hypothetical protein
MKQIRKFLCLTNRLKIVVSLALVLGSLFMSATNVAAQTITPVDPSFQDGVEKYVGYALPGGREPAVLVNVGFTTNAVFTSVALDEEDNPFFLDNVIGVGTNTLFLTIRFQPDHDLSFGDYTNTLRIHAGNTEFVLPLRATAVPLEANPTRLTIAELLQPGETSPVPELLTIVSLSGQKPLHFEFTEGTGFFDVQVISQETGTYTSLFLANVLFTPPLGIHVGTIFRDTLAISLEDDPSGYVIKIPVTGRSLHIDADTDALDFGKVPAGIPDTLDVHVRVNESNITGFVTTDNRIFSVVQGSDWNPERGGTLHVIFTPDAIGDNNAYLIITEYNFDTVVIPLTGEGSALPVLSTNYPDGYTFEGVTEGTTVVSPDLKVSLKDPIDPLDNSSFSIEDDTDNVFSFRGVVLDASSSLPDSLVYWVNVAFSPEEEGDFFGTLVVQTKGADPLNIELIGNSISSASPVPALSPQQATAISGQEVAKAPTLLVTEGNVVVSGAPAGSSIRVYNLQGQALTTQTATSSTEILQTASFPRSGYVVVVNNDNGEILRKKVTL